MSVGSISRMRIDVFSIFRWGNKTKRGVEYFNGLIITNKYNNYKIIETVMEQGSMGSISSRQAIFFALVDE